MEQLATEHPPRRRSRLTMLGLLTALTALVVGASPAGANHAVLTGSGSAPSGTESITTDPENPPMVPPFCLEVEASTYTFDIESGEFEGAHPAVTYTVDPAVAKPKVTFETQETYYISPEGTYGDRIEDTGICDPSTYAAADPVATDVTVTTSDDSSGAIACTGDAEYYRANTELVFEWDGECDVTDNDGSTVGQAPDGTEHVFTARIIPPGQPQDGEWNYVYVPTP